MEWQTFMMTPQLQLAGIFKKYHNSRMTRFGFNQEKYPQNYHYASSC
jgi:hypothetical protein